MGGFRGGGRGGGGADQLTKRVIEQRIALNESHSVIPGLSITHVQNTGIAFGVLPGRLGIVSLLTAAAVVWMLVHFARSGARHTIFPVALGLLVGGSVSNLFDRVRQGHVTDFIHITHWPTFNLADSFIVVGVLLLALAPHADRAAAAARAPAAGGGRPRGVTVELVVPEDAGGARLDRFLAENADDRLAGRGRAPDRHRRGARGRRGAAAGPPGRRRSGRRAHHPGARDGAAPCRGRRRRLLRRPPPGGDEAGGIARARAFRATPGRRSRRRSSGRAGGGPPGRAGIVHRLDRDTSGLLVVARDEETLRRLQAQLRRRRIRRTYVALVRGRPPSRTGQDRGPDRPRPARPDPPVAR